MCFWTKREQGYTVPLMGEETCEKKTFVVAVSCFVHYCFNREFSRVFRSGFIPERLDKNGHKFKAFVFGKVLAVFYFPELVRQILVHFILARILYHGPVAV